MGFGISRGFLVLAICLLTSIFGADAFAVDEKLDHLQEALQGELESQSPFDRFDLLRQEVIGLKRSVTPYRVRDDSFRIQVDRVKVVQDSDGFISLRYQGETFHRFLIPSQWVIQRKNFILFKEHSTESESVKFVDLRAYKSSLGKNPLPIFEAPFEPESPEDFEALAIFSQVQQTAVSMTAALLDPKKPATVKETIRDFSLYAQKLQNENTRVDLSAPTETLKEDFKQDHEALKTKYQQIFNDRVNQRKFRSRLNLIINYLQIPRDNASKIITTALTKIGFGYRPPDLKSLLPQDVERRTLQKRVRYTAAMAAAAVAFAAYPDEVRAASLQTLILTDQTLDFVLGSFWETTKNIFKIGGRSFQNAFAFVTDGAIYSTYFEGMNWRYTLFGLGAFVGFGIGTIFAIHTIVNVRGLYQDFKAGRVPKLKTSKNPLDRVLNWLVRFQYRQQREESQFLHYLLRGRQKEIQNEPSGFSETEEQTLQEKLERVRKKDRSFFERFVKKAAHKNAEEKVHNFRAAFKHFIFSSAAFSRTIRSTVPIQNTIFGIRSFLWAPTLWAATLLYPGYMGKILFSGQLPTMWNGGLRRPHEVLKNLKDLFLNRDSLLKLKAWENRLVRIEKEIHALCFEEAYAATVSRMASSKEIRPLTEGSGLSSVSDPDLRKFRFENRHFFRTYYRKLFDAFMLRTMKELSLREGLELPIDSHHQKRLKSTLIQGRAVHLKGLQKDLPAMMEHFTEKEKLRWETERSVQSFRASIEKWSAPVFRQTDRIIKWPTLGVVRTDFEGLLSDPVLRAYRLLDPRQNMQANKIKVTTEAAKNPIAIARAVRASRASILVDKPLELLIQLAVLAGVTEGILKPVYPEMFSANSTFYLSTYAFYSGYLSALFLDMIASPWLKLYQDNLNEGHFDDIPQGLEAEGSYFRWFYKKMNDEKTNNSWWENQRYWTEFIWANIPATLSFTLMTQLPFMHRFELDAFLMSYVILFGTPYLGFSSKIEQGFELSTGWFARDFTARELKHPLVQQYLNDRIQMARYGFNIFYRIGIENPVGEWMDMTATYGDAEFGPKALNRQLMGGYTSVERAVQGLEAVRHHIGIIPGVTLITNACESLLTNLYEDGVRLPEIKGESP